MNRFYGPGELDSGFCGYRVAVSIGNEPHQAYFSINGDFTKAEQKKKAEIQEEIWLKQQALWEKDNVLSKRSNTGVKGLVIRLTPNPYIEPHKRQLVLTYSHITEQTHSFTLLLSRDHDKYTKTFNDACQQIKAARECSFKAYNKLKTQILSKEEYAELITELEAKQSAPLLEPPTCILKGVNFDAYKQRWIVNHPKSKTTRFKEKEAIKHKLSLCARDKVLPGMRRKRENSTLPAGFTQFSQNGKSIIRARIYTPDGNKKQSERIFTNTKEREKVINLLLEWKHKIVQQELITIAKSFRLYSALKTELDAIAA